MNSKRQGVPHKPASPTLKLTEVSVAYAAGVGGTITTSGTRNALEAISFEVQAGQRVAVVGPNGAGKSTLLKLIAGTIRPSSGRVSVFGHGPHGHICIAYVPQRSQIDWTFPVTVGDVVMMGRVGKIGWFRRSRQVDGEIVRASLERVNAAHLANKQIGELSGGQQQRVFIARALAQEAELVLLDEPMSGLDMHSYDAIFTILDGLRDDGVTVLVATHDLDMAAERFDRIMLLNRRMIAFGPPVDVLNVGYLLQAYGAHGHSHTVRDALTSSGE